MSYLGRGLDDIGGKPFGWAWHQERDEIRRHLRKRIWKFGFDDMRTARLESRVTQIQMRIHRNRPSFAERQAAWKARQTFKAPPEPFTPEELAHIAERFAMSNDDLGREIFRKASA